MKLSLIRDNDWVSLSLSEVLNRFLYTCEDITFFLTFFFNLDQLHSQRHFDDRLSDHSKLH